MQNNKAAIATRVGTFMDAPHNIPLVKFVQCMLYPGKYGGKCK
jgi:hypothetical protein